MKKDTGWGSLAFRVREGSGAPLVFLHGTGCDASDWERMASLFPSDRLLIFPEFRGHGLSETPSEKFTITDLARDVVSLAESLKLDRPFLVGHSLGGMVALGAARLGFQTRGLILLEGWTSLSACAAAFDGTHMFGALPEAEKEAVIKKSKAVTGAFRPDVWSAFWETVRAFDAFEFLSGSDIPVLEIYGLRGLKGSVKDLRVPGKANITMKLIDGAGHYLPHEVPEAVMKHCSAWLAV